MSGVKCPSSETSHQPICSFNLTTACCTSLLFAVTGLLNHPFHLHGHRFVVKGVGWASDLVAATALNRSIAASSDRNPLLINMPARSPPHKDTVSVPSKGYVVLRFRADNPGKLVYHRRRWAWSMSAVASRTCKAGTMVGRPHCHALPLLPAVAWPRHK